MKASLQLLTGCVALLLTLLPNSSKAAAPAWAHGFGTALLLPGQVSSGGDTKQQADGFLRQARQAIKAGDFAKAEGLISQAEGLKVEYGSFLSQWSDTPQKLRTLLAEEKSRKPGAPKKPSTQFPALLGSGAPEAKALPMMAASNPATGRSTDQALTSMMDDAKAKAKMFSEQGRMALQKGDKLAATLSYQKAMALKATFAAGEYSPDLLGADLRKAGVDLNNLPQLAATGVQAAASAFQLQPVDMEGGATERLPTLPSADVPGAANPGEASPYEQGPASYPQTAQSGSRYVSPDAVADASPMAAEGQTAGKPEAQRLMAQARAALDKGDLTTATKLAEQSSAMGIPEAAFGPGETRPWQVVLEVNRQATRREGMTQASGNQTDGQPGAVAQGVYNPQADNTRVRPASTAAAQAAGPGQKLFAEGMAALDRQDRAAALAKFTQAWKFENQLDDQTRQQLKDKLTFLRGALAPVAAPTVKPASGEGTPSALEQVGSQQEILRQKLVREIQSERRAAEDLAKTEPRQAAQNLRKLRDRVSSAELDGSAKKMLLGLVDRSVQELDAFIDANKSTIENDERNNEIKADIARDREMTYESQNKLAQLVDQFNNLMDDQRFPEAEVLAKQARELAPDSPVTETMIWKSTFARNIARADEIKSKKEAGFMGVMTSLEESSIPFDDRQPWVIHDVRNWKALTTSRQKFLKQNKAMSPTEREIQSALNKSVEVRFVNKPMSEVLDTLSKMTGINIHADASALHTEGVTSDTPVTLNLTQPISLKSALSLILGPQRLSYVVQDEVLKVTSQQNRDSNVYTQVYYVADLVIPIPNFVPGNNIGLPGALRDSLNALGRGGNVVPTSTGALTIANNEDRNLDPTYTSTRILAQQNGMNMPNMPGMGMGGMPGNTMRGPQPLTGGPGGLGGGVQADFDSLIELITSTVEPDSWLEGGAGKGTISGFDTNLSLVVRQTQEVHEQIADLLTQLRRLQDLQVTIEVRFITLSDRFFERIGVDFDMAISDKSNLNRQAAQLSFPNSYFDGSGPSATIGLNAQGTPTSTLDLTLTTGTGPASGGFASTTPQFGGFDANTATNFGFAILSDIQAYFLISAAQGDDRTNVLQAPKVTLFNGQQATVSDVSSRPFVTSVIPVVGDFAAAYQPVVITLNEGTTLSVQAVVSADRRFVRLTLVPFFSKIGDVETFQFTGSSTSNTGTATKDPADPTKTIRNSQQTTTAGTTVQLPTFAFTSVNTTVSVPDGGTVLLGGIKRLREGRNERGTPLLSKIPYISRLFRNVGIGRDAQSLMMMVTPRIIIQEEEEEKLGINIEP